MKSLAWLMAGAIILLATATQALPEGQEDSSTCTGSGCHGMADPAFGISLTGPATLGLGESANYTLSVDPTLVGAGFAAELLGGGFLTPVSPNTETQGSAVTHNRRNDGVFSYDVQVTAPPGEGTVTLQASILAYNDGNGADGDTWNLGTLDIDVVDGICGNGLLEGSEQCDDGNTTDGDGCSAACETEGACGNGTVNAGEECDDGNTIDADGCSAVCLLESQPLVGDVKLKVGLKFNKPGKDAISLKIKSLQLPDGFVAPGAAVTFDVGGNVADVTLDPKGKFKLGSDKAKLKQGKDGTWKLSWSRKGSLAADLADEGLADEDNPKPGKAVTVDTQITAGGQVYVGSSNLTYKSKLGKNGKAK